jgi:hypothetical protein
MEEIQTRKRKFIIVCILYPNFSEKNNYLKRSLNYFIILLESSCIQTKIFSLLFFFFT